MIDSDSNQVAFREKGPDNYILTTDKDTALKAAWSVLQATELEQHGAPVRYNDDSKDSTLSYLGTGGEERPLSGIFAVELYESDEDPKKIDLLVSNRNAAGDNHYRGILRNVVQVVGIEQDTSDSK
ncbi:hypothetical protein H7X68_01765 [Candidatus Saccharibacteria bacterium]|nr:hypothetical protein [Candidatus Saccharibacteria bacterium]